MKRFVVRQLLFGLMLTIAVTIQSTLVFAQSCDQTIVDEVGLFSDRMAEVQDAVQQLENAGTVVKIVTMSHLPAGIGNLDQWEKQQLRSCPSWLAADGVNEKSNLVVLVISMQEKQWGIYYGPEWRTILDEKKEWILYKVMRPRFHDGDFAQGFINGIQAVTEQVQIATSPPSSAPAPVVVKESGPPPDLAGLWKVMGWALGLIFFSLTVILGLRFFRNFREEQERRSAAQLKAQRARSSCSALILASKQPDALEVMLPIKLASLAKLVTEETLKSFLDQLETARSTSDAAQLQFGSYNTPANDPSIKGRSVAEYSEMSSGYEAAYGRLEAGQALFKKLDGELDRLKQKVEQAPLSIAAAANAIVAADAEIAKAMTLGFRMDSMQPDMAKAKAALTEAQRALDAHDAITALNTSVTVAEQCAAIMVTVKDLPQRKDRLGADLEKIRLRIPEVERAISQGRLTFEAISTNFAPANWKDIQGNGTEAEKRLALVKEMLEPIASAMSMDHQDWETAEQSIIRANERLDAAESFMRSIVALQQHLEAARTSVPRELEAARNDLAQAVSYEQEHDADIDDGIKARLRQAESLITQAATELQAPLPDYVRAGSLAKQAHEAADAIMDQQRGEYEAAERLRQKAATALRNADHAVSSAKEYIEDHRRDVHGTADDGLRSAGIELDKARSASTPVSLLKFAESATAQAEQALSAARSDVSAAERRRRREREEREEAERRENERRITISNPSHHHDYGSWGTGGGGGSGSSFSIGGGGGGHASGW